MAAALMIEHNRAARPAGIRTVSLDYGAPVEQIIRADVSLKGVRGDRAPFPQGQDRVRIIRAGREQHVEQLVQLLQVTGAASSLLRSRAGESSSRQDGWGSARLSQARRSTWPPTGRNRTRFLRPPSSSVANDRKHLGTASPPTASRGSDATHNRRGSFRASSTSSDDPGPITRRRCRTIRCEVTTRTETVEPRSRLPRYFGRSGRSRRKMLIQ